MAAKAHTNPFYRMRSFVIPIAIALLQSCGLGTLDPSREAEGFLDTSFASKLNLDGPVDVMVIDSNDRIYIGGRFSKGLARLSKDGELDSDYHSKLGTGFNGHVITLELDSNGKLLVGGRFTQLNDSVYPYLVRLNTDGSIDSTFNSNIISFIDNDVYDLAIDDNQNIYVVGSFIKKLAKLNKSGTQITTFSEQLGTSFNLPIYKIVLTTDGIYLAGAFTSYKSTPIQRLAKISYAGNLDSNFLINTGTGFNGNIFNLILSSQNILWAAGDFNTFNSEYEISGFMPLSSAGKLPDSITLINIGTGLHNNNFSSAVYAIAEQKNTKVILGGSFSFYSDTPVANIIRIDHLGNIDKSFNTNINKGFDSVIAEVKTIALQSDDKIIVGGSFNSFNGQTVSNILRIK